MKKHSLYTVNVYYTTGDSFNSYNDSDIIGMCWENKELALQAVEEIKAHNEVFTEWGTSDDKKRKNALNYPWCNERSPEFTVNLESDDGSRKTVGAFWIGYFEYFHYAEVVELDE